MLDDGCDGGAEDTTGAAEVGITGGALGTEGAAAEDAPPPTPTYGLADGTAGAGGGL